MFYLILQSDFCSLILDLSASILGAFTYHTLSPPLSIHSLFIRWNTLLTVTSWFLIRILLRLSKQMAAFWRSCLQGFRCLPTCRLMPSFMDWKAWARELIRISSLCWWTEDCSRDRHLRIAISGTFAGSVWLLWLNGRHWLSSYACLVQLTPSDTQE
jgi:hypothetical protein